MFICRDNPDFDNEVWLFYGCRYEKRDFLYSEELYQWKKNKTISHLHLAFSRDQPEKIYIQHKIQQVAAQIFKILTHPRSHIFLCSDTKGVAEQIELCFRKILLDFRNETPEKTIQQMKQEGRYSIDNWGV